MTNDTKPKGGLLHRTWRWLWSPSARWSLGSILAAGGIAGIVFWGGFNTFMEYTNTVEFCVSCHEMGDNVGAEWQQSAHYKNASGVRAGCPDCHVPKQWTAKLWRKIQASNELYHHFVGTIDTPEKFEAKRAELAEHVWAKMKANDSRECRNCHSYEAMDFHKQTARAQEKMKEGLDEGKTCIECHTGVAHKRPPRDD
jgi:nitrate/TMAO reductase-like tetraheme cytochrome c subunit